MHDVLKIVESLTQAIVDAALAGDWEELLNLHRERDTLLEGVEIQDEQMLETLQNQQAQIIQLVTETQKMTKSQLEELQRNSKAIAAYTKASD